VGGGDGEWWGDDDAWPKLACEDVRALCLELPQASGTWVFPHPAARAFVYVRMLDKTINHCGYHQSTANAVRYLEVTTRLLASAPIESHITQSYSFSFSQMF